MFSNAGGSVGTMYRGSSLGTNISYSGTLTSNNFTVSAAGTVTISTNVSFTWTGRSRIFSPADGNILIENNAQTSFNLLQFGGTTSSFPALKVSGSSLQVRLADDSAYSSFGVGNIIINSTPGTASAGQIILGSTTASTVGAAGGASALPATPLGYMQINVAGTAAKIPYYNN